MNDTALRELIESKLEGVHAALKLAIDHERELRQSNREADAMALRLQATEMARRLDDLNHEAARLAADKATYLPREHFEVWRGEFDKWKMGVSDAASEERGRQASRDRTLTLMVTIAAALVSAVVTVVLKLTLKM